MSTPPRPEQLALPVPAPRETCPRCTRVLGIPIEYGLPDEELRAEAERGEVAIGGCIVRDGAPDRYCTGCGYEWVRGPLPRWWPPVPSDKLSPAECDLACRALDERTDQAVAVVDTLRNGGLAAAAEALEALLGRFEQEYGERDVEAGLSGLVVPRDRVLVALLLEAAVAVCRSVEAVTRPALFPHDEDLRALGAADDAFRRAEADLRHHGNTDFAELEDEYDDEDDEDDEDGWLTSEDRFAAAARTGDGSEMPPVGEEWDDWLADIAAAIFTRGSSLGWARYVWSAALAPSGLTELNTEMDRARAVLRLKALDVLRDQFFTRIDEEGGEGSWWIDTGDLVGPAPRVSPFVIGVLAGAEGVAADSHIGGDFDDEVMADAVGDLVRAECDSVAAAMTGKLGVSRVFAEMWASRFEGARYPLGRDALDIALNENLTAATRIAFEWIGEGMQP
ncbi:MAG: hypothetical protein AB7V44_01980 [Pseudonocardia sp.]